MNYMSSKLDLENFSDNDLFILSKYYDISSNLYNKNDLLWLLSISINRSKKANMNGDNLLLDLH